MKEAGAWLAAVGVAVVGGGLLLFAARSSAAAPKRITPKVGEIWRFKSIVEPAPDAAMRAGMLRGLEGTGATIESHQLTGSGLVLVYTQRIAHPTTLQLPGVAAVMDAGDRGRFKLNVLEGRRVQ